MCRGLQDLELVLLRALVERARARKAVQQRREMPGHPHRGPDARKPRLDRRPEPGVGPVLDPGVERHLDVVAAEHRAPLRREREAARRVAIRDLAERRRLREDAEPAERVDLFVLPQCSLGKARARYTMEAVAPGDEIAVDPPA